MRHIKRENCLISYQVAQGSKIRLSAILIAIGLFWMIGWFVTNRGLLCLDGGVVWLIWVVSFGWLAEQLSLDVVRQATFLPDTVLVDAVKRSHLVEYKFHMRLYTGIIFDRNIHLVVAVGTNLTVATDIEHGIQITEGEIVALRITLEVDLIVTDIDLDAGIIQTHIIPDEPAVDQYQLIRLHRQVVDV